MKKISKDMEETLPQTRFMTDGNYRQVLVRYAIDNYGIAFERHITRFTGYYTIADELKFSYCLLKFG